MIPDPCRHGPGADPLNPKLADATTSHSSEPPRIQRADQGHAQAQFGILSASIHQSPIGTRGGLHRLSNALEIQ